MPHLKFTRDHRGYENTFLVDVVGRRGREQSRVLYWFRSPPQVKVGRAAIDEDAIRALEDAYPGVTFDWNRILEARPPEAEPVVDDPRRRPRGRGKEREARRDARPERPAPPRREPRSPEPPPPAPDASEDQPAPAAAFEVGPDEFLEPAEPLPFEPGEPGDSIMEDTAAAGETDEPPPAPAHASEPSAAERSLGSEGLLRLRARHAEVCARIAAQVEDAARQDALRTLAEGLNPDAWVTDAEVRSGLEQFEQVLDQIRREVGPLRRRTRRGGRRNRRRREAYAAGNSPQSESGAPAAGPEATVDEDDGPGTDEA